MSDESDNSAETIVSRARELAGKPRPEIADAEILAAISDGTLAFEDVDETTLERCVRTFGINSVLEAFKAGSQQVNVSETEPIAQVGNEVDLTYRETIEPARVESVVRSGGFAWWRRRPVWLRLSRALATAAAVILAGLTFILTHRQFSPPIPANQPLTALQWPSNRPFDPSSLKTWGRQQPPLPTHMPDFASSQSTLGAGGTDHFAPWRLATVIVRSEHGWGSGAIISADGWILTNYHVVATPAQSAALTGEPASLDIITAEVVEGRLKPRPAFQAALYRADPVHDLALLKLRTLPPGQTVLPYFRLASQLQDGEECYVIGSQAKGPAWWVRSGRVSQQFDYPEDLSEFAAGAVTSGGDVSRDRATVIVSDTRISPGDSGGPLLNTQGELIGLTFATAANATAGSVGWHIALKHLENFLADLPHRVEGVPFDVWTVGLPEATMLRPGLADADHDGRIDSLRYRYAARTQEDSNALQPVAFTVFVDLRERSGNGQEALDLVPYGIWGLDRGRFRFDVFQTARADHVRAAGYTDSQGIVDEIRVARAHEDAASVIWHRGNHGGWTATRPSPPAPLIDPTRLAGRDLHRLQIILGQLKTGADSPSSEGSNKPWQSEPDKK
jgi:S1-C subfamily serine protease